MNASDLLYRLAMIPREDLLEIKGIGDVLVDNLDTFIQSERYHLLLAEWEKLEARGMGLSINPTPRVQNTGDLAGQIICITGSFDSSRSEIKKQLEARGAQVTSSVTGSTTLLLAGNKAGSKLEKAQKRSIPIFHSVSELNGIFDRVESPQTYGTL